MINLFMPLSAHLPPSPYTASQKQGRSPALFGAMVVVASFIHGGLLLIPLPSSPPPPEPEQVENVPITRLPSPTPQRPAAQNPLPNPQPPKPQLNPQPSRTSARPPNPQPAPVTTPQANPQPTSVATPQPNPPPAPVITPQPNPQPTPTPEPESEPTDLIPNFPHLAGAVAGCQNREDCYAVPGETLRGVTLSLRTSLEAQGYQVQLRSDLGNDQGTRVYAVTHPDRSEPLFLSVFSFYSPETGDMARYVLTQEPVEDLADL